ncbi:hypothetical protein [Paracoccus sp. MKU1]|uniref:hypothetical protein n=1 Tax=Paracoccus sp. MKU1 TaxID=1745182 RepID=UPI0007194599|nr:hypothetical protein [Paracoccus sp. MKU1]KRW96170.1 hypothetical protein AQY21_11340 [Paracoccus sp. MKU1]
MKILLFQIYGNQRAYHLELTYSILSAMRFLRSDPAGIRVVLAADAENHRPDLPVDHLPILPDTLLEWQMNGRYKHAIQAYALHHAVRHFNAPTILIDSDTVFHSHPKQLFERIGPGKTLMHAREGILQDSPEWPEWENLIRSTDGVLAGWPVSRNTTMHNAGVLGLHPQDAPLMEGVKAVMQEIRAQSSVFTAVQLAASVVFGTETELSNCDDLVEHYWNGPRAYYHHQMKHMFPDVLQGGGVGGMDVPLMPLEKDPPSPLPNRIAARIKRMRRNGDSEYAYAYLAYLNALSLRDKDLDMANVWAVTALDMLCWGVSHQHRETAADFALFVPASLDRQNWMQPALRKRWHDYWTVWNSAGGAEISG